MSETVYQKDERFRELVRLMRMHQRAFFNNRYGSEERKAALEQSRKYERQVDAELDAEQQKGLEL